MEFMGYLGAGEMINRGSGGEGVQIGLRDKMQREAAELERYLEDDMET